MREYPEIPLEERNIPWKGKGYKAMMKYLIDSEDRMLDAITEDMRRERLQAEKENK